MIIKKDKQKYIVLLIHLSLIYFLFFNVLIVKSQKNVNDSTACESRLKTYINILASDSMQGREIGSEGIDKANNWIKNIFHSLNLQKCDTCLLNQIIIVNDKEKYLTSENIYAYLLGTTDKWIIICAHYDHIGFGGRLSRSYFKKQIHNGADDNASGVAMMIEIASALSQIKSKKYNYLFAALTAHEVGLWGSKGLADSLFINPNKIEVLINLDMLGRLEEEKQSLIIYSSGKSLFEDIENKNEYEFNFIRKHNIIGDHSAFDEKNISVAYLSTGIHNDYHTINDKAEFINYKGMVKIKNFLMQILLKYEE